MKVKSNVKAGKITTNHNQTVACAGRSQKVIRGEKRQPFRA